MKRSNIKFLAIAALAVLVIFVIASQTNLGTQILGSPSPVQFQACINHADNSQACNNSVQPTKQSIVDSSGAAVTSIQISSPTVKNPFNVAPSSWTIVGTASWSTGTNCAISASGSGAPPSLIPLSIPCSSLTTSQLQSSFGSAYGQKNVTATLSGFMISGSFPGVPPVTFKSPRVAYANFVLNYGAPITTSSSTSTTSVSTSTPTSTSTSTEVSGGSVTTSSSMTGWTTIVSSASNGATGSLAASGIIADCQPYAVQSGYTLCFVYIPAGYPLPSCPSGSCGQVTIVTQSTSVGAFGLALTAGQWTQANIPVATSTGDLVIAQVFQSNQMIYNQAITISQPTTAPPTGVAQVPVAPYTQSYLIQINTSTVSSYSPSSASCPYISPSKCVQLSIVSVTF